ncbi:immunoglobulin-like domain-containing protein [Clostridium tertium]
MKRFTAFALIFMMFFSNIAYNVNAAVNVGQANQVLYGDYVVIVNTNLEKSQSTGSIIFDDSGVNINSVNEVLSNEEVNDTLIESNDISNLDNEQSSINTKSVVKTTYTKGEEKLISKNGGAKTAYTLIGIGDKCYIWIENSLKESYDKAGKTDLAASEMIKVYEGRPYEILNELSNGNIPYLDNSGKLSILLEKTVGSSGYYGNEDDITSIHINTKDPSEFKEGGFDSANGLLAHEGQHALFRLLTCGGDAKLAHSYSWINEGISVAVMDYLWGYYDINGWLSYINNDNEIRKGVSLLYSSYRNKTSQDYSMPYLFVRYLAAQATNNGNPIDFLKKLYKMKATGKTTEQFMNEIIATIPNLKGKTFKDVLGSFYVAAFSPEKTGEYSFYGDPVISNKVTSYPIYLGESGKQLNLDATGAIVVKTLGGSFTVPSDAGSDVKFYAVTKNNNIYKPANGSGTTTDPYIITNEDELNSIGKYPNAYFKLGNNIEIKKESFFTAESFTGTLDGNGYTISNLNKPLVNTNSGTIRNLNVNAKFNIEAISNLSVIANENNGLISDIKVNGEVSVKTMGNNSYSIPTVGGIVSENKPAGVVERVAFEANLNVNMAANGAIIGGIVGYNTGTVRNTYSKGNINVSQSNSGNYELNLGGLIGKYSTMGVGGSLRNSYSIMSLTYNGSATIVKTIGSLIGNHLSGQVYDSYGIDKYNPIGNNSTNLTGKKTLEELKNQNTFANWDFNATWKMDNQGDRTPIFVTGNDINSISARLSKDTFFVGEKLYLYGSDKLNINGTEIELKESMLNMNEFDSSTAGQNKVINGSYMGKNFTVTYNVVNPTSVSDLQIYKNGKVEYVEGENYSDEGVVLKAKLNGDQYNYTYIYSGFTNNLNSPLTKNDTEVKINYFGQTVSQNITVKEKQVSSITVFSKADKSNYIPGKTVDLNGIRYQINYSDGSKSKVLGYGDLAKYNLKVAQTDASGKNSVDFDLNKKLDESDDNKKLYIYSGSKLPGESGAISAEVVSLSVAKRLYMEDKTFRGAIGREEFWFTDSLQNAKYDVKTTKKSGDLPPGIKLNSEPNSWSDSFRFTGTPTTLGTYVVTYTIEKLDGSDSIDVTFTFNIENISSEAKIEEIFLYKNDNNVLSEDIKGVIDDVNNTIKFTVPYGTDISKLIARPTFYKNSTLPNDFIWYGGLDFTNSLTKPILYEVTAEDGKTKRTYKVSVEVLSKADAVTSIDIDNKISEIRVGHSYTFVATVNGFGSFDKNVTWKVEGASSKSTTIDNKGKLTIGEDEANSNIKVIAIASGDTSKTIEISIKIIQKEQLAKVEELAWDRRLAKWAAILNAKTYELNLYKDGTLVETIIVTTNQYDLTEVIRKLGAGDYSFTIVAKADGYKDSEVSEKSKVLKFKNAKPVITGATNKEIEFGTSFNEKEGVTASDEEDEDITSKISVEGTVNTNKADVYTLKYSVTDSDNNTTTVERKITVKEKPVTPPQNTVDSVVIEKPTNTSIETGQSLTLKAVVTGTGNISKDVNWSIEGNNSSKTNIDSNGVLTISNDETSKTINVIATSVTDKTKSDTITISVIVRSNEKPVITGVDNIEIKVGTVFDIKSGVEAIDKEEGNLTEKISATGNFDYNTPGEYKITYSVTDKDGNTTTVVRIINVVEANVENVVINANNVTIKVGDTFKPLEGVTVTDPKNPNIIDTLKYTSDVDTTKSGVYKVVYEVVGSNGKLVTKTIAVTVLSNEKPVITGADDIEIEFGSSFDVRKDVKATDYEDSDLTEKIVITGEVNTSVPGTYEITYSVTDKDGNTTTIIRKVIVKQEEKPVIPEKPETPEVPETPETPEVPEVPVEPENPGIEEKPEAPNTSDKPNDSKDVIDDSLTSEDENKKNELPQTGATISNMQTSVFAMLSIAIGTLLSRRKRK